MVAGGAAHLSWKGREVGSPSARPRGRSESLTSDLSLKEGNLGEGERNMSEQSKSKESGGNKDSTHEAYLRLKETVSRVCLFQTPPESDLAAIIETRFVVPALTCAKRTTYQRTHTWLVLIFFLRGATSEV